MDATLIIIALCVLIVILTIALLSSRRRNSQFPNSFPNSQSNSNTAAQTSSAKQSQPSSGKAVPSMIPQQLLVAALTALAKDPQMIGRLCTFMGDMPNIEMTTQGGKVWWSDVASVQGWRMQRHKMFGNCRILDPNNVRKAWGSEEAMMQAFQRMLQ